MLKQTERYQIYTCCSVFISLFCPMEFSSCTHSCVCFHWPLFYLVCPVPVFYTLVCMFYIASHTHRASHSLLSKCWHISFKCTVFISHSLCPSPSFPPISLLSPRRIWICLGGINPQTSTAQLLFLLSSLLSFTSPPTVSSDFYCQQLGIREHLSEASFLVQLCNLCCLGYCLFIWLTVKSSFFLPNYFNAYFFFFYHCLSWNHILLVMFW